MACLFSKWLYSEALRIPTASASWEMDVASKPCTENSSSAASSISCLVFPFAVMACSSCVPNFLHYTYRAVGCQALVPEIGGRDSGCIFPESLLR